MTASPVDRAVNVSWATVGWSVASGIASLIVGLETGSLSLGGLGAGVLVDVVSSVVLIWRFRRERAHGAFPEAAERRAQTVAAVGLVVVGVALLAASSQHLAAGTGAAGSFLALALAAVNLVVLPVLAGWKYSVARAVGSLALRTDAHITVVSAGTALLALVGLALDRGLGAWWADPAAALVIGVVAMQQGVRSLRIND